MSVRRATDSDVYSREEEEEYERSIKVLFVTFRIIEHKTMLSWDIIWFCILRQRHTGHLNNNNCWRREQWKYIFRIFCQSQNSFKNFFPVARSTQGYTFLQSHILISIPLLTCEAENVNSLLSSGIKKIIS